MSNILSEVHPELVAEWSERNLPLTPDKITYGSNKVVWWKGACGHEWQTSVKARSNGENCPICSGARVIEGINDLATLKPELADEWSSKNDPLKPTMVTIGSHAAYRGLGSSTFKGDAYGSDKQYSFRLLAKEPCQSVHLFEAAIDLLSYATLLKAQGKDYKSENLLSLSGVYQPKKESKDSKIPIALSVFLEKNPLIKTIHLHLDNDKTGRLCTKTLKELLGNKYEVFDEPPKKGKDYNDYLCIQLGIYKSKERSYER